jgi:4'-phosphopantetheinyl transferase
MPQVFVARVDLSGAVALRPEIRDALERTLDSRERSRAARFVRDVDRARFIVAHAGLRRWLGLALGCAPEAVRFSEKPGGKPELSAEIGGAPVLSFNLSHSPTLALVAWSEAPVGVDVEDVAREVDDRGVGEVVLSRTERVQLAALPEGPSRRSAFYAAWTRKEALLKALGTGLSRDATSIDLVPSGKSEGLWSWTAPETGISWVVLELNLGSAHRAALATPAPPPELVFVNDEESRVGGYRSVSARDPI